ncbi:hypothetical protein EON63_18670 [archaeon]|nr:MAG: hypothetical protein EON63_18670 [archaeon]
MHHTPYIIHHSTQGLNILFQDVDLVWFREPWQYFKQYMLESQTGEGSKLLCMCMYFQSSYSYPYPYKYKYKITISYLVQTRTHSILHIPFSPLTPPPFGSPLLLIAPLMGFFSDDGQRSKRYTPFFANSGFYYLKSSTEST